MTDNLQTIENPDKALPQMELASTGQRFLNYLLDSIFVYISAFVIGIILYIVGLNDLLDRMNNTLFGILLLLFYYVPQEALLGWTLGKLITGTRVVREDGMQITFGQALGRNLCRFIPFDAFTFLGGGGKPIGWHDSIPKTRVISVKKK